MAKPYKLYYWPTIQGRGEFVRLALEEAGAPYIDVSREKGGTTEMTRLLDGKMNKIKSPSLPFAPPFLKAGKMLIGQTSNILLYLGEQHGLAPVAEAGRLWVHQLQLTIADWVSEIHDTHHPIAPSLYYEDQKSEARRYGKSFRVERLPKFLDYFERVLEKNERGSKFLAGARLTYADLSLFQVIAGLIYAFPSALKKQVLRHPKIFQLADRVAERPLIASYLKSPRRIPFNQEGIFRHYKELDVT
jgi:glutathione S-transferase